MDEEIQDVNVDVTTTESSPVENDTVEETEVSDETDDSEVVENASEIPADGSFVPRSRLNEVKTKYESQIEELNNKLSQFGQAPVQEEPYIPVSTPQPVQYPDWVFNQDGEIIPEAFMQFNDMRAAQVAEQTIARKETEQRIWNDTYKEYPQLQENPSLKNIVENAAFAEYQRTGRAPHPKEVAAQIFGVVKTAKQEAVKNAQVKETIQKTASLDVGGSKVETKSGIEDAFLQGKQTGDWDNFFETFVKSKK